MFLYCLIVLKKFLSPFYLGCNCFQGRVKILTKGGGLEG